MLSTTRLAVVPLSPAAYWWEAAMMGGRSPEWPASARHPDAFRRPRLRPGRPEPSAVGRATDPAMPGSPPDWGSHYIGSFVRPPPGFPAPRCCRLRWPAVRGVPCGCSAARSSSAHGRGSALPPDHSGACGPSCTPVQDVSRTRMSIQNVLNPPELRCVSRSWCSGFRRATPRSRLPRRSRRSSRSRRAGRSRRPASR